MKLIGNLYYKTKTMEESYGDNFKIIGDLSVDTTKNSSLVIFNLTALEHSAVYYCAASVGSAHRFRSSPFPYKNYKLPFIRSGLIC